MIDMTLGEMMDSGEDRRIPRYTRIINGVERELPWLAEPAPPFIVDQDPGDESSHNAGDNADTASPQSK